MYGNAFNGIGSTIKGLCIAVVVLIIICGVFMFNGCGTKTYTVKKMVAPQMKVITTNNKSDTTYTYKFK